MARTITPPAQQATPVDDIVGRLSDTTVGVAIHMKKWRISKELEPGQKKELAAHFGAESTELTANKKLINTKDETYRAVNRVVEEYYQDWQFQTIPYPQTGVRLINRDQLPQFRQRYMRYANRLEVAVQELDRALGGLMDAHRDKLGTLFNESDYPRSVAGLYDISFDVVDINPPSYLAQLDPALFREQMERAQSRIEHSVTLLESEFLEEMAKFTEQLVNGLSPNPDGKRKSVQERTLTRVNKFLERAGSLNLNSSGQLNELIRRTGDAVNGRALTDLRTNEVVRAEVRDQMAKIHDEVANIIDTRVGRSFDIADE